MVIASGDTTVAVSWHSRWLSGFGLTSHLGVTYMDHQQPQQSKRGVRAEGAASVVRAWSEPHIGTQPAIGTHSHVVSILKRELGELARLGGIVAAPLHSVSLQHVVRPRLGLEAWVVGPGRVRGA